MTLDDVSNEIAIWNVAKRIILTSRFNYSVAFDDNPAATQHLFVPSVTLALTRNVDFQVEYVRQHVQGNAFLPMIEMEDGLQFLVHWHF